jgi:holliday junction DNA helicase RuvA
MIEFLDGELAAKSPEAAIVQVSGVGFHVQVPLSTYDALPREGRRVRLFTHLQVREDGLSLFGFATELERRLFRMLTGVSGISSTIALRVLGSCSAAELKRLILDGEADVLSHMVKGIGAKIAGRMVLELKKPIEDLEVVAAESAAGQAARDAAQALVALGESRLQAERAVREALVRLGPDADHQQLLQEALSR